MIEDLIKDIDLGLSHCIHFSMAQRYSILPLKKSAGYIDVLTTDKTDPFALDEYRMGAENPVRPVKVSADIFSEVLQKVYEGGQHVFEAQQIIGDIPLSSLANEIAEREDILASEDDAPIIQLVNSVIVEAVRNHASDIHIEPFENDIIIRFRVDGILHNVLKPPKPVQALLMSRIKVMAGLNIAEKRLPQDGGMRIQVGQREIDVRISVLPTSHGERIVLRLLTKDSNLAGFGDLGMSAWQVDWVENRLSHNCGIILVTGPTGSGKSTTLYAALSSINTPDKNIITVEDPIEYSLAGVGQIQVNPKIGLTFAKGLRSILRQDPDVIMIGEIRDLETAQIAIQASLTGHLVFSTLHTNDSVGAITRLIDMGIEPFLVGSSLEGIIAQRLVRQLCPQCREEYSPPLKTIENMATNGVNVSIDKLFRPAGCEKCMQTGYRGRTALFELLTISDSVRELIDRRAPEYQMRNISAKEGMKFLRDSGLEKVMTGQTSLEEILRVTQEYNGVV